MGMFDTILVPRSILIDLNERESELLDLMHPDGEIDCQTKDLACSLDTLVMDSEGNLTFKTKNGWYGEQPDIDTFTGTLNFYTSAEPKLESVLKPRTEHWWIEYDAEYSNGKMVSIKRI